VLRIDLTRADSEPFELSEHFRLPEADGSEDVVSLGEAGFSGRVERLSKGYMLEGVMSGGARLRCARCLTEFPFAFEEHLAIELLPLTQAPADDEVRLGREELEVRFYAEPELDLGELAAEQLVLMVPLKPLCQENCQGLCPRCGADLNLGRCACPANVDGRWDALARWRPSH
jgi:uncharacterized protein